MTDPGELTVQPLSDDEMSWVVELQRVLSRCPDRLELVTMGDPTLLIVDRDGAGRSELCDGAATRDGVVLARVAGGPLVHGVSA